MTVQTDVPSNPWAPSSPPSPLPPSHLEQAADTGGGVDEAAVVGHARLDPARVQQDAGDTQRLQVNGHALGDDVEGRLAGPASTQEQHRQQHHQTRAVQRQSNLDGGAACHSTAALAAAAAAVGQWHCCGHSAYGLEEWTMPCAPWHAAASEPCRSGYASAPRSGPTPLPNLPFAVHCWAAAGVCTCMGSSGRWCCR